MIADIDVGLREPVRKVAQNVCALQLDIRHGVQSFVKDEQIPSMPRGPGGVSDGGYFERLFHGFP